MQSYPTIFSDCNANVFLNNLKFINHYNWLLNLSDNNNPYLKIFWRFVSFYIDHSVLLKWITFRNFIMRANFKYNDVKYIVFFLESFKFNVFAHLGLKRFVLLFILFINIYTDISKFILRTNKNCASLKFNIRTIVKSKYSLCFDIIIV